MAKESKATTEARYDGVTIVKSKKYRQYADLLCCELDEGKTYTEAEIGAIVEKALRHPVKKSVNA